MTDNGNGLVEAMALNNGGFGGNGIYWLFFLFLFAFGGWGGNGWGGGNNVVADMQRGFDQQAINSQLQGINATLNANQMNTVQAFSQAGLAGVQGFNAVNAGIADLKYVVATENCADRQTMSDGFRDLMAQNTANTNLLTMTISNGIQQIKDDLCAQRLAAKDAEIANLQNQLNMANLAASQTAQTSYLISQLKTTTTAGA